MSAIYEKCDEKGIPRCYADSFYYRLMETPLKHTENALSANNKKYVNLAGLTRLKSLLEILLEVMPDHEKADEWHESIKLFK